MSALGPPGQNSTTHIFFYKEPKLQKWHRQHFKLLHQILGQWMRTFKLLYPRFISKQNCKISVGKIFNFCARFLDLLDKIPRPIFLSVGSIAKVTSARFETFALDSRYMDKDAELTKLFLQPDCCIQLSDFDITTIIKFDSWHLWSIKANPTPVKNTFTAGFVICFPTQLVVVSPIAVTAVINASAGASTVKLIYQIQPSATHLIF